MIKASVDRYSPVDTFDVSEEIQVYDRATALILDHILNHLKVIATIDPGVAPDQIRLLFEQYYGWNRDPSLEETMEGSEWRRTRRHLVNEVKAMIALFATDDSDDQRARAYDALNIPFLDYHYEHPSQALSSAAIKQTPQWRAMQARRGNAVIAPDPLDALLAPHVDETTVRKPMPVGRPPRGGSGQT